MFYVFMPQQGSNGCDTDTLERSGCSFFTQLGQTPVCNGPQTPPVRGESKFPDFGELWCVLLGVGNIMGDAVLALDVKYSFKKCTVEPRKFRWESWRAAKGGKDPI